MRYFQAERSSGVIAGLVFLDKEVRLLSPKFITLKLDDAILKAKNLAATKQNSASSSKLFFHHLTLLI